MRTQQRDGRAGSASGRTSMRRLWPTSTALMSRHFSSFTALPAPQSQRPRVTPQRLLPPHRSTPQSTPWTPSTALSWPVTIQCWAHRCRSAPVLIQTIYWFGLHVTVHTCATVALQKMQYPVIIKPVITHYINHFTDWSKVKKSKLAFSWLMLKTSLFHLINNWISPDYSLVTSFAGMLYLHGK